MLKRIEWKLYKQRKKSRLINREVSIISSTCNGGIISHDLGLRFNTPTINAGIYIPDMVRFIKNIDYYLKKDIKKIAEKNHYYYGRIDDIAVRFTHYKSFDEAIEKWNIRRQRVKIDNLFLIATDRDGYTAEAMRFYDKSMKTRVKKNAGEIDTCTYEEIKMFDGLPVEHKVIFTHKLYPEFKSAYCIKGFENEKRIGILSDFKPTFWRRRYIDDFDYVSFLNGKSVEAINLERRD